MSESLRNCSGKARECLQWHGALILEIPGAGLLLSLRHCGDSGHEASGDPALVRR